MSSYKKKKHIKQMAWWCVWYISHSFSYYVQCAKTCWSLCHVSIVTCHRSFVGLHLFRIQLCLQWIFGHHWKCVCVCSVQTMSWLFLSDFGWVVSPLYSIKINFLYLSFRLLLLLVVKHSVTYTEGRTQVTRE